MAEESPPWPCHRHCLSPQGNFAFMVANYAEGKRRFDSYSAEADALDAAGRLARQLSERDVLAASMTQEQAIDYASATQALQPLNLSLASAVATLSEAVKIVGDLPNVLAAARFYAARHKRTTPKRVAGVSKYGIWNRLGWGILDLLAVAWYQKRRLRPVPFAELKEAETPPARSDQSQQSS